MISTIARRIFAKLRSSPTSEAESTFLSQQSSYAAYRIGEWSYGDPRVMSWSEGATLEIGRFCSLASGVTIMLGGEHRVDWVTTYPFNVLFAEAQGFSGHPRTKGDVIIGHDVWIGAEAFILSGVRIGHGAVVAARSVVTKDIAPYSIVAGNPARHIRNRFTQPVVDALLRIEWWNWPISKVMEALPLLLSPDIDGFIEKYQIEDPRTH
jgi:acetyltransferase-like isoleucine patch superfamily enzyme